MLVIFIIYILNMLIIFTINKNKKKINAQIERIIISQTVIGKSLLLGVSPAISFGFEYSA